MSADRTVLRHLANAIASRRCALLAGAGITAESGGATWAQLLDHLRTRFGYSSPLTDGFQMLGDLSERVGRPNVYEAVRQRLREAAILPHASKLLEVPWFAVFTSNYDLALEKGLTESQSLSVRTVVTGQEFALAGLPSELLCVKLMGSLDIPSGQPGAMVLDAGDVAVAREQRSRIFEILATHAANLSFLFVGYSFEDGIFLEILDRIVKALGKPKQTYYVVFRSAPNDEKAYLLKRYGVEVIVADLPEFVEQLVEQVTLLNPADLTQKKVPIGGDIVSLRTTDLAGFFASCDPVFLEQLGEPISPSAFFRGDGRSLKPFELEWHFRRKKADQVMELAKQVIADRGRQMKVIAVQGNPGSGRTFAVLAAVHALVRIHRAVAIRLPSYTFNPMPTAGATEQFLLGLHDACKRAEIQPPSMLVFWAEYHPEAGVVSQFVRTAAATEFPMALIFEALSESHATWTAHDVVAMETVDVGTEVSEEEKTILPEYLIRTVREHRFPEIQRREVVEIVSQEKTFLPILYRVLDPARRSIDRIVTEEFSGIQDPIVRHCIGWCALATSVGLELPVAVLRKALGNQLGRVVTYPEAFEIATERAAAFLKESIDARTNPFVSIYHVLIARKLLTLVGTDQVNDLLLTLSRVADLRSKVEAEFIGKLLIEKGVNWEPGGYRPFSEPGLEGALLALRDRQPARPVLHHLARLFWKRNEMDDRVVPLLEQALSEPPEPYALAERKEHVMSTLANVKWDQNRDRLVDRERADPEIQGIISLLLAVRQAPIRGAHPFHIHARILRELWRNKEGIARMALVNEALEVLDEGLTSGMDDLDQLDKLEGLKMEILAEIDVPRAEGLASELANRHGDGTGYYTLARLELDKNKNPAKASLYLDKALQAERFPLRALALKLEILLQDTSPNYSYLREVVDRLSAEPRFEDSWRSAYHKAVVYVITGHYENASRFFHESFKRAPGALERRVQLFWMEMGHRKALSGKIGDVTQREGRIYSHPVSGWPPDIFFDPRRQPRAELLQRGVVAEFELGFSPRGPIAFDVRPKVRKRDRDQARSRASQTKDS